MLVQGIPVAQGIVSIQAAGNTTIRKLFTADGIEQWLTSTMWITTLSFALIHQYNMTIYYPILLLIAMWITTLSFA